MLTPDQRTAVANSTRILQIIIFALAAGVLSYAAVIVFAIPAPAPGNSTLAPIAAGFAVIAGLGAVVMPRIIAAQQRQADIEGRPAPRAAQPKAPPALDDVATLLEGYQVRRIIAAAILEGAAFFNAVAYQLERRPYSLGVVIALVMGILSLFPVRAQFESWLERDLRTIRELRDLRR